MAPRPTTRSARRGPANSQKSGSEQPAGPSHIDQPQADLAASAVENPDPAIAEQRGAATQDLGVIARAIELMGAQIAQLSKTVQDVDQRTRGRALNPGESREASPRGSRSRSPLSRSASEDRAWLDRLRRLTGESERLRTRLHHTQQHVKQTIWPTATILKIRAH